jgi:hypothetical protein
MLSWSNHQDLKTRFTSTAVGTTNYHQPFKNFNQKQTFALFQNQFIWKKATIFFRK